MTVADLSHGGMKLEGAFQLGIGDTVEVSVDLGAPSVVAGRVVMGYPTTREDLVSPLELHRRPARDPRHDGQLLGLPSERASLTPGTAAPSAGRAPEQEKVTARPFQCLSVRADRTVSVVLRNACAAAGRRRLTSASAIAGPLEPGAQVGLQLPQAGTCAAQVASCDGRALILELLGRATSGGA